MPKELPVVRDAVVNCIASLVLVPEAGTLISDVR